MGRTESQIRQYPLDNLTGTEIKTAGIRLATNINSGGWGSVYLGRQSPSAHFTGSGDCRFDATNSVMKRLKSTLVRQPPKLFAIKVLRTAQNDHDRRMQEDEARIHLRASARNHPNVIKLHQVVKEQELTFFVLDFCPGGDLFGAIMHKQYYGNVPAVKSIITQIANGLDYLHSISVFHRDLKPENILITSQRGEAPTVAIADFGLSSESPTASAEVGSTFYMSPECLGRYGKYYPEYSTAATDVWALGSIILALVLDRVLPWSKALDECEAFRDFTFDSRRWLMRRWNISERLNGLLVHIFELNPYRRITAAAIPRFLEKVDEFVVTTDETKLALEHYTDSSSARRREREIAYYEGRFDPLAPNATLFRNAITVHRRDNARPAQPLGDIKALESRRSPRKPFPLLDNPYRPASPSPEAFAPLPNPVSQTGGLGLTGVGHWLATGTIGNSPPPVPQAQLPVLDEDERRMQDALIAAHRLEGQLKDGLPTHISPSSRRSSFLKHPSPLQPSRSLPDDDGDWPTDEETEDFDEAPPPLQDDNADTDSPNSSMPPTPRNNRLKSITGLERPAGIASLSSPSVRRGSLPRLLPPPTFPSLGVDVFDTKAVIPSLFYAKAKAANIQAGRRGSLQHDRLPSVTPSFGMHSNAFGDALAEAGLREGVAKPVRMVFPATPNKHSPQVAVFGR